MRHAHGHETGHAFTGNNITVVSHLAPARKPHKFQRIHTDAA